MVATPFLMHPFAERPIGVAGDGVLGARMWCVE